MWFSGFFFPTLSLTVEVYQDENYRSLHFFVSGKTWKCSPLCVFVYVCVCVCVCVYMCVYMCIYIYIYILEVGIDYFF